MSSVYSSSKSSGSSTLDVADETSSTWKRMLQAICTTFYLTHTNPFHKLSVFVFIFEFIQFYTFCLANYLDSFGPLETPIGNLSILREWGSGYLPHALHQTISFFALFFLIGVAILGGWVFWVVESGTQPEKHVKKTFKVTVFHVSCHVIKLGYLPLLYYFDDIIHCTETDGELEKDVNFHAECWSSARVVLSVLFAFATFGLILEGFLLSVFSIEWIPSKESQTSMVNARFSMLMWFCKTTAFFGSRYFAYLPSEFIKIVAYGILLVCLNLAMLAWMIFYLPFHQPHSNLITIIILTVSTLAAIVRTFSAFSSGSYAAFIAFIIIQGLGGAAAMFFSRKRIQRLYRMGIDTEPSDSENANLPTFEKEFEVEVAARKGYYNDEEATKEEAFGIFMKGVETFPHSLSIRLAHVIFMLSQLEDVNMLAVGIQRVQRMNPPIDYMYLIFCLETHRKNAMYLKDGGFQEISDSLRVAVRYQEKAKKCIRAFWGQLIKEQNLHHLRDIVINIEHNEQKAEGIFQRLMRRFPRSAHLLRSYAQFCEEVKNDFEAAQESCRLADELEEEKSKRNSKKKFQIKDPSSKWQEEETEKPDYMVNNFVEDKPDSQISSAITSDSESEGGANPFPISRNASDNFDARLNQTAVTAFQQNAEKARMRRRNMILQRVYKERIENTKSNALKKLQIATKVSIATLLLAILVVFIASVVVYNGWAARFADVAISAQSHQTFYSAAFRSRDAQLFAVEGNLDGVAMAKTNVTSETNAAERIQHFLNEAQNSFSDSHEIWIAPTVPEFVYIENPPQKLEKKTSLDDLMLRMLQSLRMIASFDVDAFVNANFHKDFRYLMDNCPRSFSKAAEDLTAAFLTNVEEAHSRYYTVLMVCLPLSVFMLTFVTIFFFYPAQQKIKRERNIVLKLFVSIPKSVLTGILGALSPEKDEDVPRDAEEEAYNDELAVTSSFEAETQGMPIIRKMIIQYALITTVCGCLVLSMAWVGVNMKVSVDHLGPNVRYTHGEGFLATRLMFLAREYVLNDTTTWEGGRAQILSDFNSSLTELIFIHTSLRQGNEEIGCHHMNPVFFTDYPCQYRDSNATCSGLESLFVEMISNSFQLMNNAEDELTLNNTYLLNMLFLAPQMVAVTDEMCDDIIFQKDETVNNFRKRLGLILGFAIPALVISYFVLRSSEWKIKKEDERTMKMLLMIPADVIDNVASIRDYLNGVSSTSEKSEEVSADIIARNKSIVDGSVDAVIVIDQKGSIQVWNPTAVKLFGFAVEEAIGKNITIIIPDEIAKHHDGFLHSYVDSRSSKFIGKTRHLTGKHKDGHQIPVSLSLSEGKIGEKLIFCGFLRDVSDVKKWENEINNEKEKSQQLLYSFLPQYIATQLIQDQQSGNSTMIAEAFKEVTVLFADIVGFTKLSAKVSPSELIHLLNRLFSVWDNLCEKHHVEKIKTIGDCYMAACGVPERCVDHAQRMIEFAQDMLQSLQDLNRETNSQLQLRIGVNTGNVVAGVIGTRKMAYDLWGDAVNVASRMESSGVPGKIQVSQTTFEFLKTEYLFEERGRMEIKGKGTMLTYLLKSRLFERTNSGHTKRRSAMTPVILKNLRSNTSGLNTTTEEFPAMTNQSPHSENENDIEMQGIPLSEMVALEDEFGQPEETTTDEDTGTISTKPKSAFKSVHMRATQAFEPNAPTKSPSTSDVAEPKPKKVVRKNVSLPNAVEVAKAKGRIKFAQ